MEHHARDVITACNELKKAIPSLASQPRETRLYLSCILTLHHAFATRILCDCTYPLQEINAEEGSGRLIPVKV